MVVRDSIVSSVAVAPGAAFQPPRFGVLAADIARVETARFSPLKTIAFIGAVAAVSIGWASAVGTGGGSAVPVPPDPKGFAPSFLSGFRFVLALSR